MHQTSKILFIALLIIQNSAASQEFNLNAVDPEYKKTLVRELAKSFYPTLNNGRYGEFTQKPAEDKFYQEVMENNENIADLVTHNQLTHNQLKNAFFNAVYLKESVESEEIILAKNIVSLMINLGVDINTKVGTNNENILMRACQWNVKIVPFLLDNRANATHVNEKNKTVLHYLFQNSSHQHDAEMMLSELIPLLVDAGVNVNHEYTLTDACWNAPEAVPYLLAADCNIDVVDSKNLTPLQILFNCSAGNFNATKCLLDAGADTNVVSKGLTLLEIANFFESYKVAQLLRNAGAK